MSKLKNNMIYQILYQLLSVIIPLITSPYLSRVLGAEGLGIYSYSYSIVSYFMLFALLGVATYGMRVIAQSKGIEAISKNFWEIYAFQSLSSIISIIVYIFFVFIFSGQYKLYLCIQILYILGEGLNISWLFFGLEKYKVTVIRSIIIKLATLICIFIFVKKNDDVWLYIFILSAGHFLSNLILWIPLKKYIIFTKIRFDSIIKHIKPNLILFIPVAAASVYHVMDKTMLGMFSDAANSGYYYNADKLVNIPLTIITGCSNVFMSRISVLVGENNRKEVLKIQNESVNFGLCVISAVAFGVVAVSKQFVPWFFGKGFEPCIELISFFAVIIVVKTISIHTRAAFLIPEGNDSSYAKAVICGAVVNLIANYILIKVLNLGAKGATIGTLIAEVVVCLVQFIFMKQKESRNYCIRGILTGGIYIVFGMIMLFFVNIISIYFTNNLNNFLIIIQKIVVGAAIYICCCLLLWRFYPKYMPSMIRETIESIKRKINRGRLC